MIPAYWLSPLPLYLWQAALHSWIVGAIFYAWASHIRLPSGRSKRRLLAVLLVLPLLTAAVPGRSGAGFRDRVAWLDSARLLALPLPAGLRLYNVVLVVAALTVALTVWQEILPALRRPRTAATGIPDGLARMARGMPGWSRCAISLTPTEAILLATSGWPGHPRLIVSRGALAHLGEKELLAVLRHEHAHWRGGRWISSHALFVVRLLQCCNPVALWAFREYCLEVEIDCDAEAVAGTDPRLLTRTLLTIYESTDRRDVAARSSLRKRVDVLLDDRRGDDALPVGTIAAATLLLLLVLPWVV